MTQHHEGLKLESDLAILRWQRLMEQALSRRVMRPPGLLTSGEPAFALIACSAGWRDTTRRNALPDLTTIVLVTTCESLHDVRDTGGL